MSILSKPSCEAFLQNGATEHVKVVVLALEVSPVQLVELVL